MTEFQEAVELFNALCEVAPCEDVFERLYRTAMGDTNAPMYEQIEAACLLLTLYDGEDE